MLQMIESIYIMQCNHMYCLYAVVSQGMLQLPSSRDIQLPK